MIVFNLYAIPVVIVTAILGWGTSALFGLEGSAETLGYAGAATLIGGLAEVIGLKGRLFWLPIWLIGLAGGTYSSWDLWGWGGLGVGLALIVAGVIALVFLGKASNHKAMQEAPRHYEPARAALSGGDLERFWDTMLDAYVAPSSGPVPREFVSHSIAVLDLLLGAREQLSIDAAGVALLEAARSVFVDMERSGEAPSAFSLRGGLLSEVAQLVVGRGAYTPSEGVLRDVDELRASTAA